MRLILPVILAILGVVGGGAVGMMLKPDPAAMAEEEHGKGEKGHADKDHGDEHGDAHGDGYGHSGQKGHAEAGHGGKKHFTGLRRPLSKATDSLYHPIEKKLIVPIQRGNGRKAFVVLDVTLEVAPEELHHVEEHEPKIIDAFLRVMIAFSATGAFNHHAETAMSIDDLSDALQNSAEAVLGHAVRGVLISNLITQDA